MKKFLFLLAVIFAVPAFSQSAKMDVKTYDGALVGKYIKTNTNTYTVETTDYFDVPKEGHKIVTYRAEDGWGDLYCKEYGTVNVRSTSSTNGTVIAKIVYEEGYVPETYMCLGKENGWYKLSIDGKIGYVRQDLLKWEGYAPF